MKKRIKYPLPKVPKVGDVKATNDILEKVRDEAVKAIKANDRERFFLCEKKFMMSSIAYCVRFRNQMSKKKNKVDINHIYQVLL
ncbi:MAG: hypothetical protein KAS32_28640, partial [Candidatus Peribacteraceae bacterium]|nr:hypothetical protein [Candidatus Peribacteraceae bacterium]